MRNAKVTGQLAELQESQWLHGKELQQWQLAKIRELLCYANDHVPYYRNLFVAHGISVDKITSLEDITPLPILTKNDILAAGHSLLAEHWKGQRFLTSTSGTTGLPLDLWRSFYSINKENAFLCRQLLWAGAKPYQRRVWIRGSLVAPMEQRKPPFWRYNLPEHTLMMSPYHLSEQYAEDYLQAMEAFDPVFGMAYPSPVVFLARYLLNKGRPYKGKSLQCFITSSETFTPEQKTLVRQAFGCNVFDWYGSAERVAAIGTCEQGNYHILSDYGYTELLPQGDGTYELLGTGFDNLLMPLIRYRLNDVLVMADKNYSCPCGRNGFPVVEQVIGRVEDYLLKPDGQRIYMAGIIIEGLDSILESQIRQESPHDVKILLVPVPGRKIDRQKLLQSSQHYLGSDIRVHIDIVNEVPRTSNGKFRAVVRAF